MKNVLRIILRGKTLALMLIKHLEADNLEEWRFYIHHINIYSFLLSCSILMCTYTAIHLLGQVRYNTSTRLRLVVYTHFEVDIFPANYSTRLSCMFPGGTVHSQ